MFYTYIHSFPHGKVFYVGKGIKSRAFSTSDRSLKWKSLVKKQGGFSSQILAEWKTEEEAFEHEKFLIACFKDMGYELVNQTSGGKGVTDYCQTKELREYKSKLMVGYKHKIITCPNCGHSGGETTMKRWHFDKCKGYRPFKSRTTINGKRVFLGRFATKEEADAVAKAYKESH